MDPVTSSNSRRRFLWGGLALAGLGLMSSCSARASPRQDATAIPRIGVISGLSDEASAPNFAAFRVGLRERGYQEGRNIIVEWRTLDGHVERAPAVVDELLRLGPAAIVAGNPPSVQAAQRATRSVPVIMAGVYGDPVAQGGLASLNRPGGNVTGLSLTVPTLQTKRQQLLRDAVPMANRLAALLDRTLGESVIAPQAQQHAQAAWSLGVEVRPVYIGSVDDLEPAFDAMRRDGVEAVSGVDGGVAVSNARRVADLALQHRLPTIFLNPVLARAGALMSYGVDQAELYRRAVGYVDKVLNGADPAELPVEQPDKFHFVINLRTAQALSLTIPEVVLQQATEVIQ